MSELNTLATDAKSYAQEAYLTSGTLVSDFKTLIATRIGDALVGALVLVGVVIGHALH